LISYPVPIPSRGWAQLWGEVPPIVKYGDNVRLAMEEKSVHQTAAFRIAIFAIAKLLLQCYLFINGI